LSSLPGSNPGVSAIRVRRPASRARLIGERFGTTPAGKPIASTHGEGVDDMSLIWTALAIIGLIAVIVWVF
jgi:hypothetical protein